MTTDPSRVPGASDHGPETVGEMAPGPSEHVAVVAVEAGRVQPEHLPKVSGEADSGPSDDTLVTFDLAEAS